MERDQDAQRAAHPRFGPSVSDREMAHYLLREWDGVSAEDAKRLAVIQERLVADDPAFGELFTASVRTPRAGRLVSDGTAGIGVIVVAAGGVGVWRPLLALPLCALGAIALVAHIVEQRRARSATATP
jgi:Protein of unknown function (DUF3040)